MVRMGDFEDLQTYVHQILCSRADLGSDTPLIATTLKRSGRPCGVEFTLVAPRSVRLSAIWEAQSNRILFYDQNLDRFQVTRISGLTPESVPSTEIAPLLSSVWQGK